MELSAMPMESLAQLVRLQLENGGRSNLLVTGVSMHPILRHRRDRVELIPPPETLRRGDLILYQRADGQYVLHRIVSKPKEGAFVCSGDNQWTPEDVTATQVVALVDVYIRKGKAISANAWPCRLYVWLWVALFPVRKPLLQFRRYLGRLRKRVRKWFAP